MTRYEKINHLIKMIKFVEGEVVPFEHFSNYTDEKIDKEIEFYGYVSEK